jgi:hypothetical protein
VRIFPIKRLPITAFEIYVYLALSSQGVSFGNGGRSWTNCHPKRRGTALV